jgi:hypothetical protein
VGAPWAKRPSLIEIDSVLRNQLEPEFANLEASRRAAIRWLNFAFLAGLGALFFFFYLSRSLSIEWHERLELFLSVFTLFEALVLAGFVRARRRFRLDFKEKVMQKVANHFFPGLTYRHDQAISRDLYDDSQLFHANLDTYEGNDYFRGRLGEVDFEFSELLCQFNTGSGKSRRQVTAFRGFFFVGDFHREIYFRTQIRPDTAEKFLGVLGRGLQRMGSGSRLVDLENPEFEQAFVVTSDDQVEARYILTPVFMEKLLDFRRRVGSDIHLCFVNGRMMLAIETNHDFFEPKLLGEILRRKDLLKFIDMLILLTGVAEEFLHHPKFGARPPMMPPLPVIKKK